MSISKFIAVCTSGDSSVRKIFLPILGLAALLFPLGQPSAKLSAQSAVPTIVVFKDNVPFKQYRNQFREDERFAANPKAWKYLKPEVVGTVQTLERQFNFRAEEVYSSAIKGFVATLTPDQIQALQRIGWVRYAEPDQLMTASAQTLPWGIDRVDADISSTQAGNGSGAVSNVNVYVIDTGAAVHSDLNVVNRVNFTKGSDTDCNGHGTHVAGTVAAIDNSATVVGAAPGATITGIKVLNCRGSGSNSKVIKGVDWVTANAVLPAVANMSLGGGVSQALDNAVSSSAQAGIVYAIAAGNDGKDACNSSPARVGGGTNNGIITVAATDINNQEASFSNYGNCVDLWAPGVNITSTWLNNGTNVLSGTSMASPHVAGVAALFLSSSPGTSPANAEAQLKANAALTGTTSKDGRTIQLVNAAQY
jgi:subtilisin family serine protease